ncbi:saccharopine dehydrogenase [Ilyomonas limi]|uniref:Saccharopine dehydrogenase n=1 Tax=Ilyomonas limi TaxID=2575867 RepID=A0A4U3KUE7_9BACT|nr:saccharopine dehydrogenase C-terminal domain-containing protein [Ilyomonas limi]TKK66165.1 saccharopine dehydrogenase [Ilyomonas limi]
MKCIVLFGAGKSATALIDYLKQLATEKKWHVIVADYDFKIAKEKTGNHPQVKAVKVNIENDQQRKELVQKAHVVISLMPPHLHHLIALDCILFHKHLLTASYVDEEIKKLQSDIRHRNLLFLCEMGLDPGIDHMSAMQLIHSIQAKGGVITSFKSHCGGLVAPESDDNPWHYKISWNPRNVVLAGKAGAMYKEESQEIHKSYPDLFTNNKMVHIPHLGSYAFYPNRDSLRYQELYHLEAAHTFIRTTLRHPDFCFGWKNIIDLKLTDEEKQYNTDGLSIAAFFRQHFEKKGFDQWLNDMLMSRLSFAKELMAQLTQIIETEENAKEQDEQSNGFLVVDENGELSSVAIEDVKDKAAETVAGKMHEANLTLKQLFCLGLDDEMQINKGLCSAADVLQFILENKLALQPSDKDMVVMLHEIEYTLNNKPAIARSALIVKGKDNVHTAMAKTVGLPLGIAAKLILEGKIKETGLHIPVIPSIYEPVLEVLKEHGIAFYEEE